MTSWTAIFDNDEELGELLDLALGDNDAIAQNSAVPASQGRPSERETVRQRTLEKRC